MNYGLKRSLMRDTVIKNQILYCLDELHSRDADEQPFHKYDHTTVPQMRPFILMRRSSNNSPVDSEQDDET